MMEPDATRAEPPQAAPASRRGLAAGIAVAVLAAVTLPLALLGGGDEAEERLLIERRGGELLVTVPDLPAEQPDDPSAVRLRCDDAAGAEVVSVPVGWPLDTDAGKLEPHIHVPVQGATGQSVATCSLVGLSRSYEGPVRG